MVFTSFSYLLLFLPLVVLVTLIATKSNRTALLLVTLASFIFYSLWEIVYLPLLLASILVNYSCGYWISFRPGGKKIRLACGIVFNLGLLGYFKYTNFFVDNLNLAFNLHWEVAPIALPLAISFFTFQQIAWLMNQYRGEYTKCHFVEYVGAVAFFPHLIAGPIVQYRDLIPQFQSRMAFRPDWHNIAKGLFLIACGTFKKIVIADSLSPYVAFCFDELDSLNLIQAWIATLGYCMQIYFDFSGYCDIAIGSALLLNIRLPDNFHSPYKSGNIREFWQRWHITLGAFITRYLYIPLGGNRHGTARTCLNILVVMSLSGLWHGAGFGFIFWGIAHGLAMVIQRCWSEAGKHLSNWLACPLTFLFVTLAWVLFRAKDLTSAFKVYRGLFGLDGLGLSKNWDIFHLSVTSLLGWSKWESSGMLSALFGAIILVFCAREAINVFDSLAEKNSRLLYGISLGGTALLLIAFGKMVFVPYTEFIYFNF